MKTPIVYQVIVMYHGLAFIVVEGGGHHLQCGVGSTIIFCRWWSDGCSLGSLGRQNKMTISALIHKVKQSESLVFLEVIATIDANYTFTPTYFKNGEVVNEANNNNGSCKVFSFAKIHNLSKEETVFLFGEHYQKVVETPDENDHQNIRNFLKFGWEGVEFEKDALL